MSEYLTIVEASNRLLCSTKHIKELVDNGQLWAKNSEGELMIETLSITDYVCSPHFERTKVLKDIGEDTPAPRNPPLAISLYATPVTGPARPE